MRSPRGPFPCAGEEQWVVISIDDDRQWAALTAAMGNPQWASHPALAERDGRVAARDTIAAHLGAWTSARSVDEVTGALQAAGVPVAPMLNGTMMLDDPHLGARGWTLTIDQPGVGPMDVEGPAWTSADMGGPITFPAPGLGEHTHEVARGILGLGDEEIDTLVRSGVLEVDPPAPPAT